MGEQLKVLILGGSGFVGARLCHLLKTTQWAEPIAGVRRPPTPDGAAAYRLVDTLDLSSLNHALQGIDAVVNCVAGSDEAVAAGAKQLALAVANSNVTQVIHMSSMAVYAPARSVLNESSALAESATGYAGAKIVAERHLLTLATAQRAVTVLRPGCIYGAGSAMWVDFIAKLLRAGRLGHVAEAGQGWSNLVHVDNVCQATIAALSANQAQCGRNIFNIAGSDSPSWNQYFEDFGVALGCEPSAKVSPTRLWIDAWGWSLLHKPLSVALTQLGRSSAALPSPIHPSFLKLWSSQARLDSTLAIKTLNLKMTAYADGLADSVRGLARALA